MQHEFEIAGTRFRLSALKLKAALRGETLVAQSLFPVLAAGVSGFSPESLHNALPGLEKLPELVDVFAPVCEVEWPPPEKRAEGGEPRWVPLSRFLDEVFERRGTLLLAWLLDCIDWQYSDFFGETGLALVVDRASRFASRIS
jgi:hypothetical protein